MTTEQPLSPVHTTAEETPPPSTPIRRDDFNSFYTQEMSAVTVFLMHQGATPYEATDAAHEAMAKLLPDLWRALDHPRTWLRVTAQRCYWRQSNTRATPTDPIPDRPGGTCPLTTVIISEFQHTILDALRQLRPTMRTVMAWDIDGFTYTEIAETLAMSPAAVRQNISRARK